jgi:hypothetical protein
MDDGRQVMGKAHMSLWLCWAKNRQIWNNLFGIWAKQKKVKILQEVGIK